MWQGCYRLVSKGGLEPPRPLRALAPQASASAIPPLRRDAPDATDDRRAAASAVGTVDHFTRSAPAVATGIRRATRRVAGRDGAGFLAKNRTKVPGASDPVAEGLRVGGPGRASRAMVGGNGLAIDAVAAVSGRTEIVMTTLARACSCSTYRMVSETSRNGYLRVDDGVDLVGFGERRRATGPTRGSSCGTSAPNALASRIASGSTVDASRPPAMPLPPGSVQCGQRMRGTRPGSSPPPWHREPRTAWAGVEHFRRAR